MEEDKEGDTGEYLHRDFGSTFENKMQEKVQKITNTHGFSPRGQKKRNAKIKQKTTNNYATVDRIKSRSQAKSSDD